MTDEMKPAEAEDKVDITGPGGIHITFSKALIIGAILAAGSAFMGHCSTSTAAASPDLINKIDNISNNLNEVKADVKDLKRDVLDLKIQQLKKD